MMVAVPLSEDEQRILRQIEQQLEQDPTFAARGYRVPRHRVALLAVGLLAAMTVTVLGPGRQLLVRLRRLPPRAGRGGVARA